MRKFEYKYRIDEENKIVIAMSTYAGKSVVGIARCAPEDSFDVEKGKKLAAARCTLKVAKKRLRYAESCAKTASEAASYWADYKAKMDEYENTSAGAYMQACVELAEIEHSLM